ncbi:hypothetical protein M3J09_006621 [Ascochyta lentis]
MHRCSNGPHVACGRVESLVPRQFWRPVGRGSGEALVASGVRVVSARDPGFVTSTFSSLMSRWMMGRQKWASLAFLHPMPSCRKAIAFASWLKMDHMNASEKGPLLMGAALAQQKLNRSPAGQCSKTIQQSSGDGCLSKKARHLMVKLFSGKFLRNPSSRASTPSSRFKTFTASKTPVRLFAHSWTSPSAPFCSFLTNMWFFGKASAVLENLLLLRCTW